MVKVETRRSTVKVVATVCGDSLSSYTISEFRLLLSCVEVKGSCLQNQKTVYDNVRLHMATFTKDKLNEKLWVIVGTLIFVWTLRNELTLTNQSKGLFEKCVDYICIIILTKSSKANDFSKRDIV